MSRCWKPPDTCGIQETGRNHQADIAGARLSSGFLGGEAFTDSAPQLVYRLFWARLLARVFRVDACPE
jgi:hypothetical protein